MSSFKYVGIINKVLDDKFREHFGFHFREITFSKIVDFLYSPRDPSSLAVTRMLFGLAMLFDISEERGGSQMDGRWGDPRACRFPLIYFIQSLPMPYMALVYAAMWLGALGIMLGYKFHKSAMIFATCYWYIFIIEKSYWNNHSYLFGLIALLLVGTRANRYLSLDAYFDPSLENASVPYWNYFVLKYQLFILYFVAGLKKGTAEWLSGYSLPNLSEHWVFDPFKLFLSVSQTDYLVVHWFAFLFDVSVAFWMMWARSRHLAMLFCAAFHLMNIRLFRIGMFPWVCLATMPLFYPFDWPKKVADFCRNCIVTSKTSMKKMACIEHDKRNTEGQIDDYGDVFLVNGNDKQSADENKEVVTRDAEQIDNDKVKLNKEDIKRKHVTIWLIIMYMMLQAFLPYSHFITKGYNNWTNGLYGYSWDMMVHTWDTVSVTVTLVDNDRNKEMYLDPFAWTPNDRWTRHGDMLYQYAQCVKRNLLSDSHNVGDRLTKFRNSNRNTSLYIDVWSSMNGRFQQRMFEPKIDLLNANWSPFEKVDWLMPLLVDADDWRGKMDEIRSNIHSWDEDIQVLFVADFPGYHLENYIPPNLNNVSLAVLDGNVAFEPELTVEKTTGQSYKLDTGRSFFIQSGEFHKVHVLGNEPAYYMYTYRNNTLANIDQKPSKPKLPITKEFAGRLFNMIKFFNVVFNSMYQIFFRMSMSLITI